MEAIELYRSYTQELKDHQEDPDSTHPPPLPPLMMAYQSRDAEDYMAKMIELVKSSEVEQTILVFPFDVVVQLLEIMEVLLEKNKSVEVVCRMFFFVVEVHFGPLSTAKELHPLVRRVKELAQTRLGALRDLIGFNIAALDYHKNTLDERQRAVELVESVVKIKEKRRKKKNKEKALQTAVLSL